MTSTAVVYDIIGHDNASATFAKVGAAAEGTSTRVQKLSKVGAVAGKALAAGLAVAGYAAIKATEAAAEDQKQQQLFANAVSNATGATNEQIDSLTEWVEKQGEAYGVSKEDLEPALQKLATATGSVSKAQRLASLAMNISAETGKSLSTVTQSLSKAQTGSVAGLSKYGIATKDASGHTISLAQATDALAAKYKGGAAAAADTAAGKQKILAVQFHELEVRIGTGLLPVMGNLASVGLKVVDWMQNNGTVVKVLAVAVAGLATAVYAVSVGTKVWSAATKIATGVQWLFNAAMDANPISLVVLALAALAVALVVAYKKSDTFRAIVNAAFSGIQKIITTVIPAVVGFVKNHWGLLVSIIGGPVGIVVVQVVKHFATIKAVVGAVADFVVSSAKKYGQFASAVIDKVGDVLQFFKSLPGKITGFIEGIPGQLRTIGGQIIDGLVSGLSAAGHKVLDYVQSLINKIPKKIRDLMGISSPSKVTTELGQFIGDGLALGLARSSTKVESAAKKLADKAKARLDRLKEAASQTRDSVAQSFTGDLFSANATDAVLNSDGNVVTPAMSAGQNFLASLTSKNSTLSQLIPAMKRLEGWGWKPEFLAQLFQSGNAGIILDLANNQSEATQAASLFGSIGSLSDQIGKAVAQNQYGDQIKQASAGAKGTKGDAPGNAREAGDTYNITLSGVITDPNATAKEIVKAIKRYKREVEGNRDLGIA